MRTSSPGMPGGSVIAAPVCAGHAGRAEQPHDELALPEEQLARRSRPGALGERRERWRSAPPRQPRRSACRRSRPPGRMREPRARLRRFSAGAERRPRGQQQVAPHPPLLEPLPADELLERVERLQRVAGAREQGRARLHDLFVVVACPLPSALEVLAAPARSDRPGRAARRRRAAVSCRCAPSNHSNPTRLALGLAQQPLGGARIAPPRRDVRAASTRAPRGLGDPVALGKRARLVENPLGVVELAEIDQDVGVVGERARDAAGSPARRSSSASPHQRLGARRGRRRSGTRPSSRDAAVPTPATRGPADARRTARPHRRRRGRPLVRRLGPGPGQRLPGGELGAPDRDLVRSIALGHDLFGELQRLLDATHRPGCRSARSAEQLEPPLAAGRWRRQRLPLSISSLQPVERRRSLAPAHEWLERPCPLEQRRPGR